MPLTILLADDDLDDCDCVRQAFVDNRMSNNLAIVHDGEELLDYLQRRGRYADPAAAPRPALILLDLNMPRKDGRESLAQIKADPELRHIPVVILTTSKAEEDIFRTYSLGANSFISKPVTFSGLVQILRDLNRYWFEIVDLPEAQVLEPAR